MMRIMTALCMLFVQHVAAQKTEQMATTYSSDPKILAAGQRLFEENCSSCHNFSQKSIGPSLQQATSVSRKDWLRKFISNAPGVIASGDPRATRLFKEYNQTMPPFTYLSTHQIDAVLAYIHRNQKHEEISMESADMALADPIPAKIPSGGGQLHLRYHSTAPATAATAPLARINKMQVLKGKKERLFAVDLRGILYEIRDKEWLVAIDIRKLKNHFTASPGLGTGFGSFAFHPDFAENGVLYTTHAEKVVDRRADLRFADSIKAGLQWVLTEWKIKDIAQLPFECTDREVLRIDMLTPSHGVQEITFNGSARRGDADYGLLFIGVGDGGAGEKKGFHRLCSDNKVAAGAVLRIDPLGRNSTNGRYGIPSANPYAGENDPAVVKEIFCRGFRNPNRITWTPDGKMLIADIGQANVEEVNIGAAGADYGWPEREGTFRADPRGDVTRVYALPTDEPPGKYTYPVLQYDHDEGKAISGGFVYDGAGIPGLRGKYVFSDITNGRVFITENKSLKSGQLAGIRELEIWIDGARTTFQHLNGANKPDSRLGIGPGGELFFFTKADGRLYEVVKFVP